MLVYFQSSAGVSRLMICGKRDGCEVSDRFSWLIKSQKGRQVLWMEIKSSFKG